MSQSGGEEIASVGSTGNDMGLVPHLHLQFEFVRDEVRVAVDPVAMFGFVPVEDETASINNKNEFREFFLDHAITLAPWGKFMDDAGTV